MLARFLTPSMSCPRTTQHEGTTVVSERESCPMSCTSSWTVYSLNCFGWLFWWFPLVIEHFLRFLPCFSFVLDYHRYFHWVFLLCEIFDRNHRVEMTTSSEWIAIDSLKIMNIKKLSKQEDLFVTVLVEFDSVGSIDELAILCLLFSNACDFFCYLSMREETIMKER